VTDPTARSKDELLRGVGFALDKLRDLQAENARLLADLAQAYLDLDLGSIRLAEVWSLLRDRARMRTVVTAARWWRQARHDPTVSPDVYTERCDVLDNAVADFVNGLAR
jgi:hypothetical protein